MTVITALLAILFLPALVEADPAPVSDPVTTTLIATLGTVAVAITVLIGVIVQARKPAAQPAPVSVSETSLPKLSSWGGTQNEFLELVIMRHNQLDQKTTELEKTVERDRQERVEFQGAVRRYLEVLAAAWPGPEKMPWPTDDDWEILEVNQTLPASWVRKRRPRT